MERKARDALTGITPICSSNGIDLWIALTTHSRPTNSQQGRAFTLLEVMGSVFSFSKIHYEPPRTHPTQFLWWRSIFHASKSPCNIMLEICLGVCMSQMTGISSHGDYSIQPDLIIWRLEYIHDMNSLSHVIPKAGLPLVRKCKVWRICHDLPLNGMVLNHGVDLNRFSQGL